MTTEDIEEKLSPDAMRILAAVIRYQSNARGMSKAAIGRYWGMPRETVRDIVLGKTWKRVPGDETEDFVSYDG